MKGVSVKERVSVKGDMDTLNRDYHPPPCTDPTGTHTCLFMLVYPSQMSDSSGVPVGG